MIRKTREVVHKFARRREMKLFVSAMKGSCWIKMERNAKRVCSINLLVVALHVSLGDHILCSEVTRFHFMSTFPIILSFCSAQIILVLFSKYLSSFSQFILVTEKIKRRAAKCVTRMEMKPNALATKTSS